ncbi:MAG: hypothetical protein ABL984_12150 [Pyrinomonadaceae bacterium]
MFKKRMYEDNFLFILRWVARISGMTSVALLLLFLFGEGFSSITMNQAVGIVFFPFGLMTGLVIGWRRELLGGAIAVGSVLGFYFIYELAINGSWPRGWWFAVFAMPGVLFLIYGLFTAIRRFAAHKSLKHHAS